MAQDMKDP